jgi:hypothetical protein
MSVVFEAGTINAGTGALEESDTFVRTNDYLDVVAGTEYTFAHDSGGSDVAVVFFDEAGDFVSTVTGEVATAPESATLAKITLDTTGVTEFEWSFLPAVTYNFNATSSFTGSPADFTWFMGDGTVLTGLSVEHNYSTSSVKTVQVMAQTKDWTALAGLNLSGCDIVGKLDLAQLNAFDAAEIDLSNNPLMTSIEFSPAVSGTLLSLDASGCNIAGQSFAALNGCFDVANCALDFSDNALTQAEVDDILNQIDLYSETGVEGRTLDISGTNETPTAAGMVSVASLEDKGWTVTITTA